MTTPNEQGADVISDTDIETLKRSALAATPQDIDSAEDIDRYTDGSHVECPACGGEGSVPRESEFCNYDGEALGVQFFGIGDAVGTAETYFRAAKPATILALIARLERAESALLAASSGGPQDMAPIPMLLFCPRCGHQHIDAPEENERDAGLSTAMEVRWTNPPHRSHLCHACECVWRPADVATVGVAAIETTGTADTWTAAQGSVTDVARMVEGGREAFLTWWCEDVPESLRAGWKANVSECLHKGNATDRLAGAWDGFRFALRYVTTTSNMAAPTCSSAHGLSE